MGYTYTLGRTRKDLIAELIANEKKVDGVERRCLKHCLRGNILWTVWELTHADGLMSRYIGCDVLHNHKGFGWGYKNLCEESHPFHYSCPLRYLDLAPEANAEWRKLVRQKAEAKARPLKVERGSKLRFEGLSIPEATVVEKRRGGTLIVSHRGRLYSIPPRLRPCIASVEKLP